MMEMLHNKSDWTWECFIFWYVYILKCRTRLLKVLTGEKNMQNSMEDKCLGVRNHVNISFSLSTITSLALLQNIVMRTFYHGPRNPQNPTKGIGLKKQKWSTSTLWNRYAVTRLFPNRSIKRRGLIECPPPIQLILRQWTVKSYQTNRFRSPQILINIRNNFYFRIGCQNFAHPLR